MIKMCTSNKGFFISFEGVDGCGKSTQVKLLRDRIGSVGKKVELVREPGGLKISEEIRKILLNPDNSAMNFETEALLMTASRAQLTEEVIRPLLAKGFFVIADRFSDSTLAYQGGGRKCCLQYKLGATGAASADDAHSDRREWTVGYAARRNSDHRSAPTTGPESNGFHAEQDSHFSIPSLNQMNSFFEYPKKIE